MRIFLVRHAQSAANVDMSILQSMTNVSVSLTPLGHIQVDETAKFLGDFLKDSNSIKVWNSSYERTRLTANAIKKNLTELNVAYTQEESIHITERQFGMVDDAVGYQTNHLDAYNHYQLYAKEKRDFFVRPMLGESAFDMCLRLDFFLKVILANSQEENHIVVSHGAAVRGLIMMHQSWPYEKYSEMKNPHNASIHFIDGADYKGQLFVPTEVTGQ